MIERPEGEFVISTSRVLPAQRWEVLRLFTQVEDYPGYLPEIAECRVLSRSRTEAITQWKVDMGKIPISWTEKDILDLRHSSIDMRRCVIRFQAIDGDLEKFEGQWTLQEHVLGGTEVFFEATLKIGVPVLEQAMGGLVSAKVLGYFERLLSAFEEILTAQSYEDRGSRHVRSVGGFGVIGHPLQLPASDPLLPLFQKRHSSSEPGISYQAF